MWPLFSLVLCACCVRCDAHCTGLVAVPASSGGVEHRSASLPQLSRTRRWAQWQSECAQPHGVRSLNEIMCALFAYAVLAFVEPSEPRLLLFPHPLLSPTGCFLPLCRPVVCGLAQGEHDAIFLDAARHSCDGGVADFSRRSSPSARAVRVARQVCSLAHSWQASALRSPHVCVPWTLACAVNASKVAPTLEHGGTTIDDAIACAWQPRGPAEGSGKVLLVSLFVCFIGSQHTLYQLRLQQYTTCCSPLASIPRQLEQRPGMPRQRLTALYLHLPPAARARRRGAYP